MKYLHNYKTYYLIAILLIINSILVACNNSKKEAYDFIEKRVDYEDYLFVAGIDSKGNIITADEYSFIIFDDSLNALKDIRHDYTEPFNCYANGDILYVSTISQSVIYRYSLQEDQLTLLDEITTGFTNASIIKMREYKDGLYFLVLFRDSNDLSIYGYDFSSANITKLDVTGVDWFDSINENELLISSNVNNNIALSVYDIKNKTTGDPYYLNDRIQNFTYSGDMHILNIYGNQLISTDLKDGTKKIVYQGAENAVLSGFIHQKGEYYYFCDTANHLLIKLPTTGVYQSAYTPSANEDGIGTDSSEKEPEINPDMSDISGWYSINQKAIDEELAKIEPISEEEFELVVLTGKYTMPNKSADAIFKRKYPNAFITYEFIQDSGLVKENGNPYESEYDRQLKLKLLANESDFDLFYITSPETLTQVVHSGGYLDLSGSKIQKCMNQMFDGVVYSCSYKDTVFGMPIYTSFYGMQVNEELVRTYNIDYPFKNEPLKYNELPVFAEKYCKDYDNDGEIDVFLTTAHEGTLGDGTKLISNSFLLNRRYETSYIDFLRNEGKYHSTILKEIDEVNKRLEPYCLNILNIMDNNYLFFGSEGVYPVNPIDNNLASYLPVFENKEVYKATYEYLCGNKFSNKKEYILEYLSCIGDVLNISEQNLIYKDSSVYEKYFNDIQIDREHFAYYQRIVDHSVPDAILFWDSLGELYDAIGKDRRLYDEGQITIDTLYDRLNQKLELILKE